MKPKSAYRQGLEFIKQGDITNAFLKFQEAAENDNHPKAQHTLGTMFAKPNDPNQDYEKAFKYHKKYANQGNELSEYELGLLYQNGLGINQDYNEALHWFKKAAGKGYTGALLNIAMLYKNGHGVQKDDQKALDWFIKAFHNGAKDVSHMIGNIYRDSNRDYSNARDWYMKGVNVHESASMTCMGLLCDTYNTTDPDFTEAFSWYSQASDLDDPDAQYYIAWYYHKGLGDIKRDYRKASSWYEKAILNGSYKAYVGLGMLYHYGLLDTKPDYAMALKMYQICESHDKLCGSALNQIGLLYQDGLGVPQSHPNSMEYFLKAASMHDAGAYNSIGEFHKQGHGTHKDPKEAEPWFVKSAYGENDKGQFNLGLLYFEGSSREGINYGLALVWFRRAHRRGNENAQDYIDQIINRVSKILVEQSVVSDTIREKYSQDFNQERSNGQKRLKRYIKTSNYKKRAEEEHEVVENLRIPLLEEIEQP